MDYNLIKPSVLAYLGDSVYEVCIRKYLVMKYKYDVNELQNKSVEYVSAMNQAVILDNLIENRVLDEREMEIVTRARNYKPNTKAKHADIKSYKKATALEALFGVLYLENNNKRIDEIVKRIVGEYVCMHMEEM